MFAKLKNEKLGGAPANVPGPANSSIIDEGAEHDGPRDVGSEAVVNGSEKPTNVKDVAFLQTKLNDLLGRMKTLKKEKEVAEATVKSSALQYEERLETLKKEHLAKRDEVRESFSLSLRQSQLEKEELRTKLEESEKLRKKIQKRDEDSDELKDFQNQELAKVKHMLINAQNQVSGLQTKLKTETEAGEREAQRGRELDRQLRDAQESLQLKTVQLRSLEEKSTEDINTFTSTLKDLRAEKTSLQNQLQQVNELFAQKRTAFSALEEKFTSLEEDYVRDKRAAEIYKHDAESEKISLMDQIEQLREKTETLESRLGSSELSEDERIKALERERITLERRLDESREQLTEIKTSWSSKITSLENQITHLNLKQVEDNQELSAKEEQIEQMRLKNDSQITELKEKLGAAEKRSADAAIAAQESELKFEQKLSQSRLEGESFEAEFIRVKEENEDLKSRATQLEERCASIESASLDLELSFEEKKKEARETTETLEATIADLRAEKETAVVKLKESKEKYEKDVIGVRENLYRQAADNEKAANTSKEELRLSRETISRLEEELKKTKIRMEELGSANELLAGEKDRLTSESESLLQRLRQMEEEIGQASRRLPANDDHSVDDLRSRLADAQDELTRLRQNEKKLASEVSLERKEKDSLLLRNAELSHNATAFKAQLDAVNGAAGSGSSASTSTTDLKEAAEEIGVSDKSDTIEDLHNQLAEKNKTVKLQQQRIADLKKTLQRELKLQTGVNSLSVAQGYSSNGGSSTEDLTTLGDPSSFSHSTPLSSASTNAIPSSTVVPCSISSSSNAAVLPNVSSSDLANFRRSSSHSSPFLPMDVDDVIFPPGSSQSGEPDIVSFRYLKHVIIRFMISNRYEAQHLVKAVSTVLRFDKEEEKLVTDHLNYKISWFGAKPSTKKLKSANVKDVH